MTRVVVAAGSPAVRAGLLALLAGHSGLTVLESTTGPSGLGDSLEAIEADVVLLALEQGQDPALPFNGQPDTAARFPAIVVLGDEPASAWAARALRSGARGVLPRSATADQILAAVLAAAAGLSVREATGARAPVRSSPPLDRRPQALSPREIEILSLLAEGLGNKTVAARLRISEHTVKTHMASIFAKLDVSTRAEAVASALRLGLIML